MLSFPVVKHLNVLEAGGLHVGVTGVANAMHPLVFEAVEPAFRRRVIPAVSFATHRADHAVSPELVLKRMAGVLATSVRVVHQRAGPVCLDSFSTEIGGALRGSVIHGDGGRRSL